MNEVEPITALSSTMFLLGITFVLAAAFVYGFFKLISKKK